MSIIMDSFYSQLAADYKMNRKASVIYAHYLKELTTSAMDTSAVKKKPPASDLIIGSYRNAMKPPSPESLMDFLSCTFPLLAKSHTLYDSPLFIHRGAQNDDEDFECILNALYPFLSVGLDAPGLRDIRKKSALRGQVEKLAEMLVSDEESVKEAFGRAGIFKKPYKAIRALYDHLIDRIIDKAFKDYLYTAGYHMDIEGEGDNTFHVSKVGGRANFKPDKTMQLISELGKRQSVFSLFGNPGILDDPEFEELCDELYKYCTDLGDAGRELDILITADQRTGCSLHILGSVYWRSEVKDETANRTNPCAFVVMNRYAERGVFDYEIVDETGEPACCFGFNEARTFYRIAVDGAADDMRASALDIFSDNKIPDKLAGAFSAYLGSPGGDKDLLEDTIEDISRPSEYEMQIYNRSGRFREPVIPG